MAHGGAGARRVDWLRVCSWSCSMAFGQVGNRDYYNPGTSTDEKAIFENVHSYHLQPAYDALKRGNWKSAHDNFEFILNGFPNSPQALNGMSELCVNKWKSPQCDADSWFDKAIGRNPSIATTWVIYGIHLERKKLPREAVEKFEHALELNPDDINAHYNLGLAFFDLKEYDKANEQAQTSYALGAPLPGLRDKLDAGGRLETRSNLAVRCGGCIDANQDRHTCAKGQLTSLGAGRSLSRNPPTAARIYSMNPIQFLHSLANVMRAIDVHDMTSLADTLRLSGATLRSTAPVGHSDITPDDSIDLSVVIPVYRSERTLPELHRRLTAALAPITDRYEILFIEDCGGDGAWEVIEGLCGQDARVHGVQLSRNFGQHAATICGIVRAKGRVDSYTGR